MKFLFYYGKVKENYSTVLKTLSALKRNKEFVESYKYFEKLVLVYLPKNEPNVVVHYYENVNSLPPQSFMETDTLNRVQ